MTSRSGLFQHISPCLANMISAHAGSSSKLTLPGELCMPNLQRFTSSPATSWSISQAKRHSSRQLCSCCGSPPYRSPKSMDGTETLVKTNVFHRKGECHCENASLLLMSKYHQCLGTGRTKWMHDYPGSISQNARCNAGYKVFPCPPCALPPLCHFLDEILTPAA